MFPTEGKPLVPNFACVSMGGGSKHPQWSKGDFHPSQTLILICLAIRIHSEAEGGPKKSLEEKKYLNLYSRGAAPSAYSTAKGSQPFQAALQPSPFSPQMNPPGTG